jgi:hypothetical protein
MTRGALIFAYNNASIDYVNMAAWSADNIHRHLDIPVCLITDADVKDNRFDQVIKVDSQDTQERYFQDFDRKVVWRNSNRIDAWQLSPWEQTLLLDADYVVASSILNTLFNSGQDFLCHKNSYNMLSGQELSDLNVFGRHKMPMWWATVIMFKKTKSSKLIFDSMNMVKQNWSHYRDLYGIDRPTYRNDFAMSIALGIVSGQTWQHNNIPWSLASLLPEHDLAQDDLDSYVVQNKKSKILVKNIDFHAMNKKSLGEIVANSQ